MLFFLCNIGVNQLPLFGLLGECLGTRRARKAENTIMRRGIGELDTRLLDGGNETGGQNDGIPLKRVATFRHFNRISQPAPIILSPRIRIQSEWGIFW